VSAKAKSAEPVTEGPPCHGCRGAHELRWCNALAGAAVLRERGRLMTAVEVEKRAGGGR
jgi:hypothetical protein